MHEYSPAPRSNRAPSFAPGDVVADRYRLERIVGEGGMGIVWAATHLTTGRAVAVKVLKQNEPDDAARLLREARVAASLQHRNIVQVFDLFQLPNTPILLMVMDLLHGESLSARIQREGRLDIATTADILFSVTSALKSAHSQGFIHRDLKPENIFLARETDGLTIVKVLDFGLARSTDDTAGGKITHTGSFLGTPHYMAPEQVYGETKLDASVDTWALGTVLVECLSGRTLFDGDNFGQIFKKITLDAVPPLHALVPGLPEPVLALAARMLSRDRTHRPTDDEVLAIFRAHRGAVDAAPARTTTEPPGPRPTPQVARGATERIAFTPLPTAQHANLATSIDAPRPRSQKWVAVAGLMAVAGALLLAGSLWAARARAPHDAARAELPPPVTPSAPAPAEPAPSLEPLQDPPKLVTAPIENDAGIAVHASKPASASPKAAPKSTSPLDIRF